jgi:hypothetical protein
LRSAALSSTTPASVVTARCRARRAMRRTSSSRTGCRSRRALASGPAGRCRWSGQATTPGSSGTAGRTVSGRRRSGLSRTESSTAAIARGMRGSADALQDPVRGSLRAHADA